MTDKAKSIPDEAWLEVARATCAKSSNVPCLSWSQPYQIWQIRPSQPSQHPLSALSQTSTSFSRLLAPKIYSKMAIVASDLMVMEQACLLLQLLRSLDRKIVRQTIESLSVDFRILDIYAASSCFELEGYWDQNRHDIKEWFPDWKDFFKVQAELAKKMEGLNLVSPEKIR